MPLLPLLLLKTYALNYHASPVLQLGCPRDTNCSLRRSFSFAASAREPAFSRRQCYQPTFPILLTYPPRYLRLTVSPVSPSSHTSTFTIAHSLFTPSPQSRFQTPLLHFLYLLCCARFYFFPLHFLTFPSTPFIVFIFLYISHAGYLTKSLNLGDRTSIFFFVPDVRKEKRI